MYRGIRLLHLLAFATMFGGLIAVGAAGAAIQRVGPFIGVSVVVLIATGAVMIATTKGRSLKQGWLRAHLIAAVVLPPALFMVHQRVETDGGVSALIAAAIAAVAAGFAAIRPRFAKRG